MAISIKSDESFQVRLLPSFAACHVLIRRAETKDAINLVTPQSVSDHTYNLLIDLYRLPVGPVVQSTVLTCLGFLFRSFPTLMLRPSSTGIMDEIFTSTNSNAQTQLMKIIHDFLSCQGRSTGVATAAGGKVKVEANAKMEELVGNVDGFADSGSVIRLLVAFVS